MLPELTYNKILNSQNDMFAVVSLLNRYTNGSQERFAEIENRLVNAHAVANREIVVSDDIDPDARRTVEFVKRSLLDSIEMNYNTLINMMQYFKSTNTQNEQFISDASSSGSSSESIALPQNVRYNTPAGDVLPAVSNYEPLSLMQEFKKLARLSTQRRLDRFAYEPELTRLVNTRPASSAAESGLSRIDCAAIVAKGMFRPAESRLDLSIVHEASAFTPARVKKLDSLLDYLYQICRAMRQSQTEFLEQRMLIRRFKRSSPPGLESTVNTKQTASMLSDILLDEELGKRTDLVLCQIGGPHIDGNLLGAEGHSFEESLFSTHPELYALVHFEQRPPLGDDEAIVMTNVVRYNDSFTVNQWTERAVDYAAPVLSNVGFADTLRNGRAEYTAETIGRDLVKLNALVHGWVTNTATSSADSVTVLASLEDESDATLVRKFLMLLLVCSTNRCRLKAGVSVPERRKLIEAALNRMARVLRSQQLYSSIITNAV